MARVNYIILCILPKTDNTYSPKSPYYKYEVSPGIRFIPNMSRLPLKSYEKTPIKHDYSEDLSDHFLASSHSRKKLFSSTTYKHYNAINQYQTHHSETYTELKKTFLHTTRSKTSKVISHVYESFQIIVKLIISYFISISTVTEVYGSVMENGSNIISTTVRKITNWVHLVTITLVHYDLIVITSARKMVYYYFGPIRLNNLVIPILLSALILFLTVGFFKYPTSLDTLVWQESWTNFLISPFISILNLITSVYQVFSSTMLFVLHLIDVTCASSIIAFKLCGILFLNLFRNINTVLDSGTQHINTIPVVQNSGFIPFDYNMLAKQVIASEEFQNLLMNQLNISQSDLLQLHDKEFHKFFKYQLEDMNSENLNWINNQLNDQRNILKNINDEKSYQDKEVIQVMEKKISELQNIVATLIKKFETIKSDSTTVKINSRAASKEAYFKENLHSITNYVEHIVDMKMKSTLSIYDADKTGMVDYALESAGATVLGTRCTVTKTATAALTVFGIPIWLIPNGPRMAIQPGVNPGECWAFIGSKGFLVLKLSNTIRVTGFTIEHLPRSLSEDGHIRSAPKDFSVWGLKHETDSDGKLLGKYQFLEDGPSLQYFSALKVNDSFSITELRIESNHGHEEYTCLYRIRIHGELA